MPAGGYFGRALVVDVGDRAAVSAPLPLDDTVLRAYLGGVGLGTWLSKPKEVENAVRYSLS